MTTLIKKLDNKFTEWYFNYLDNFVEKYNKGKIIKPLKYLSMGYHYYNFSKKGLEQIKEFEEKAKLVKDEGELENLIKEYHKKVIKTELGKWFTTDTVGLLTILVPTAVGSRIGLTLEGLAGSIFVASGQSFSLPKYDRLSREDEDLRQIFNRVFGIKSYFNQKAKEYRQKIKNR